MRLSRPHMEICMLLLRPSVTGLSSAMLGSTVVTCSCTVSGGLWTNFHFFYVLGLLGSCGRFTFCSPGCSLSFLKAQFEELNMAALIVDNGSCMNFLVFCWYSRTSRVPTIVGRSAGRSVSGLAAWRSVHSRCFDCLDCPSSCT